MAPQRKSLLMAYMHRKHKAEETSALFTLFVFISLVLALTNTNVAATALATSNTAYNTAYYSEQAQPVSYYDSQYYSYPTTSLATSNAVAQVAMWLLALVILAPIEFSLRKK
jgi:hypothetical protein